MIDKFIKAICEELNIPIPKVSNDTSAFLTPTMLALFHNGTIYIKKSDKPNPDILFAIAHELRHAWQLQTDEELYFSNYKSANELSVVEYNLQPAEVDANAYASVIMSDYFGLKPLFNGLPEEVTTAIRKRILEVLDAV